MNSTARIDFRQAIPLVSYTVFRNTRAKTKREFRDVPWSRFVEQIREPEMYQAKANCPLISLAEYGDTASEKGSLRHAANVRRVFGAEIDYDGEQVSPHEAARLLRQAEITALVYTSPSHRPRAPRWRVLLPFSKAVSPEKRAEYAARANRILGGIATRESFTLSQGFYVGRVRSSEYIAIETRGRTIDIADEIEPLNFGLASASEGPLRDEPTDGELRARLTRGEGRYEAMRTLSARWAARGRTEGAIASELHCLLEECPRGMKNNDGIDLRSRIQPLAESAVRKYGGRRATSIRERVPWPSPLDDAAFQGLIGEIARTVAPHTEADPAAILLQVLVAFGALVGRGPHLRIEGDEHHVNLFALLVGDTSKARKGTSWGRVREIFSRVPSWPEPVNGLSSGEGLKYAVRDAIVKFGRNKTGHAEEMEIDPGIADKRLLVVEGEFAQVLRQSARAGNTLSATIRSAWDTGRLATLTKNDPITATGAHIGIVGHITADELRAELTATDSANGFANRFLFMCVRRSNRLPFGGGALQEEVVSDLTQRIAQAATKARTLEMVGMTKSARKTWENVYGELSEGHGGLFGAVTARAEAQCLRLALAFALADSRDVLDRQHLLAAIAVWNRAEASARHIFGSALGNPVADDILRALRAKGDAGMTRTEIRDLFKRHESAERIGAALELLERRNLAERSEQAAQGGRPAELWTMR